MPPQLPVPYSQNPLAQPQQTDNSSKQSNQNLVVFLRGVTWIRDSHGLFDYESKSITKKSCKTIVESKIVRLENEIELVPQNRNVSELGANAQDLLQIRKEQTGYYLDHAEKADMLEEDSVDRLWLVVRSLKSPEGKEDYLIKKFDVIKLGRVKFRIKDFQCEKMGQTPEELYQQELKEAKPVITLEDNQTGDESQKGSCRFCWGSDSTPENPCIVPCRCAGTVGFIHFECLKNWLNTKMNKKESEHLVSMYWKTFECEICKQAYPYLFKVGRKVYKLIDIQQPKNSGYFMVMESLPLEKNTSRTIHILGFSSQKEQFNMGRGHDSEVRVNDISVSRCHAIIKYKPEGFYIEDNKSKFGTLVLLKESYPLNLEYTSAVQVGRTVVSFTVRNTSVDKQYQQNGLVADNPLHNVQKFGGNIPQQLFQVQKMGSSSNVGNLRQERYHQREEEEDMDIDS
ncbi:zinc finger c3hc4 fha domain-containing protein [Stylonychia lemnae]|uniref:Zinc finger c3hc4 fha domain-containing protein n=1 Tax=Stylonychia lemnae TaxID=5949 RepID=A0A078A2Y8_STYLE|nr:zinc finger c3hc4 fha domain-containing protein [Stylonychia lemnae]|eukprot:CDW76485.1 zinc finger c3hc4 fha domain-containing protein [Stylonychia lemnae]